MTKMKKFILGFAAVACFALAGGVAANESMAVSAEETTGEYTVVDTAFTMHIVNDYIPNGNFSIYLTLPQTDAPSATSLSVSGLATILNEMGFYDNIMIGDKTLKELGFQSVWSEEVKYGESEPKNIVKIPCHTDEKEAWQAMNDSGEIQFTNGILQNKITVKEGFLLPGYSYFTGAEDSIVYRASCDYETERVAGIAYDRQTFGKADVEDLKVTQGWDGESTYIGVSLDGDDYLGDGEKLLENENHKHFYSNDYEETVLINGEQSLAVYYGIFNLNEGSKGYYSFRITIPESELESITIPAGTRFPSRAMQELKSINAGNTVFIMYETQTDMTLVNTPNGFMLLEDYKNAVESELSEYRSAKVDEDYFSADVTAMNVVLENAKIALVNADTVAAIDEIAASCKAVLDGALPKADVIAAAKSDVQGYKAEEGYFRAEEAALRLQYVEGALLNIENAESKDALDAVVSSVKTEIDALKTAAQYADEELAPLKASANETINTYLQDVSYLSEEKAVFDAAKANALQAVVDARTEEEIESAVATFQAAVDALSTKESYVNAAKNELNAYTVGVLGVEEIISAAFTAIENAESKAELDAIFASAKLAVDEVKSTSAQAARDALNAKKASIIFDEYSLENQMAINALYKAAKDAIASAATQEELDSAVASFIASVDALEKLPAPKEESGKKEGCGSIVGLSAAVGMLAGACALIVGKKKENER